MSATTFTSARAYRDYMNRDTVEAVNNFFTMDSFTATMIAEGVEEADSEEQYLAAWQHLIDTGLCWQLQGWFGRTAHGLIESGVCHQ